MLPALIEPVRVRVRPSVFREEFVDYEAPALLTVEEIGGTAWSAKLKGAGRVEMTDLGEL